MEQRTAHPLDIDLLSVALGDADVALASEINDHLGTCLLCRVRIARIRRSDAVPEPLAASGIQYPSVSPEVLAVLDGSVRPEEVAPGQIWLAGDSHRMLVWVEAVESGAAFVYTATLDVDSADDTGLIKPLPRLGHSAAVVTSVGGTVPLDRLVSYVDYLPVHQDVQRLLDAAVDGTAVLDLPTGVPITGATDERLEFRQLLADDLAALDPIDGEDDEPIDRPADGAHSASEFVVQEMRDLLHGDFLWRRSSRCQVRDVDAFVAGSFARSTTLVPVANIHELDCVVLLVTGDGGSDWALQHWEDASRLMSAAGASTLAVAEPVEPYETCLFEASDLRDAFQLPLAATKSPPRVGIAARPMVKALFDYLDGSVFKVEPPNPVPTPSTHPDLSPHLRSNARAAIDSLRQIKAQKGKNLALKSLGEGEADEIADALAAATDFDDVLARLDRIADR